MSWDGMKNWCSHVFIVFMLYQSVFLSSFYSVTASVGCNALLSNLRVTVIKLLIHWKSKVRDYCSFLGNLITVTYKVFALQTVNNFNSSKINIEFEM